ncbi:MAG TPA: hypothetical protein VFG20_10530, partial [Planctomycetaceae bacterium]|nr:hypothetical protein [Planctomycetaceae bacterium]
SIPSFLRELEETERARQFETAVRPTATAAVQSPHIFLPKRRPDRGVELPTPTPPTRRPKNRWGTPGNEETQS